MIVLGFLMLYVAVGLFFRKKALTKEKPALKNFLVGVGAALIPVIVVVILNQICKETMGSGLPGEDYLIPTAFWGGFGLAFYLYRKI